ncbi:hypothetical protein [Jannaschia aquimarina]|uniref:Uncharacterized protein n=1 Tax=Jannaschia aquimarina TaxID=935700 RepID=A0A0D1EKT7_9RHOB|nr:hypothetical protein [Jannaschia aquimarina]KIT16345.1 hypothetical protein jaqu_19410 [Jannaschia aquimarina]SNT25857.1 hypothetical protein SAMN05421775_10944 [Jannaschia aquimarina]
MSRTAQIAAMLVLPCIGMGIAERSWALSCLRPSVESSFAAAQASSSIYEMAVGTFIVAPGEALPPAVTDDPNREPSRIAARFEGRFATLEGFEQERQVPVTLELGCTGPWCATVPTGQVLVFLERADDGYVLSEGACPRLMFAANPEKERQAMACLTDPEACNASGN